MANREINISSPVKGLNTDLSTSNLEANSAYTFALNAKQESEDGNMINITNEPSNTLSEFFPKGYKVIGKRNIESSQTIYFLVNPETGDSEIGKIMNSTGNCKDNLEDIDQIANPCKDCNKLLPENRGEDMVISTNPCQVYETILNSKCLNFSIGHPVHKIDYKITNETIEIYWTDNFNKMSWLDINKIPLLDTGEVDCNKLHIFPDYLAPCISVKDELDVGSLKAGVYQFFVAYSNSKGEELSQYYAATNPASIWENKPGSALDFNTNKALVIQINNLDDRYKYINIAVGKTIAGQVTFELAGTYDIDASTYEYVYTGNDKSPKELTSQDIFFQQPIYIQAETLAVQNNILMFGGLRTEETVNYQSVANNIVLKWESVRLPDSDFEGYNTAQNTANYRGYCRDEVYAFEFVPILKSGRIGNKFHIPGRKAGFNDLEIITNNDSINYKEDPCDEADVVRRYQIYDTSEKEGYSNSWETAQDKDCYIGPYEYGIMGYYESIRTYPDNQDLWGELAGQQIRHHKMPSVETSAVFNTNPNIADLNFQHTIYPLGIKVDHQNILEAIESSTLTQEQKDDIVGFQIVRATRTNNNSVIAKGLLYNVGEYERNNETLFYPNYPYNDLRVDPFLSNKQPQDHSGDNAGFSTYVIVDDPHCWGEENPKTRSYQGQTITIDEEDEDIELYYAVESKITINGVPNTMWFSFCVLYQKSDDNPKRSWTVKFNPPGDFGDEIMNDYFTADTTGTIDMVFLRIPFRVSRGSTLDPFDLTRDVYFTLGFGFDVVGNLLVPTTGTLDITAEENSVPMVLNGEETNAVVGFNPPKRIRSGGMPVPYKGGMWPVGDAQIDKYHTMKYCFIKDLTDEIPSKDGDIRLDGFKENSKSRFTFHGPNTSFGHPSLSGYVKVESIQYGKTKSVISKVLDEPKYSISTSFTVKMATAMAMSTVIKTNIGAGTFGWPTIQFGVESIAPTFLQALDFLEKLVPLKEYGYGVYSVGYYNNYTLPSKGNIIRGIDIAGYLNSNLQTVNDDYPINNYQRESSVYIKTNGQLPFPHEYTGVPVDNSRYNYNSLFRETGEAVDVTNPIKRDISSLQVSIKRPFLDQYGDIYSYRTVNTGGCFSLERNNIVDYPTLFGGDTFINRFALKRKLPFFLDNRVGFPDKSDVSYDLLGNVAYPTYWLSTFPIEVKLSRNTVRRADAVMREMDNFKKAGNLIKNFVTGGAAGMMRFINFALALGKDIKDTLGVKNTNFDKYSEENINEEGYFYLFSYGIPYFYVESDINIDLRQAGNDLDENFYPNVGTDIPVFWLQEKNVPIAKDNFYLYNTDYSKQNLEGYYKSLDRDFDPNKINQDYFSSRVIYSETSNLEERQNNWLIYKANNYYDFPLTYGKLIDLNALEQEKVLARFEDNISIYNAFVQLETDVKTAIVGTGSMFTNPPQEYSNADLGYMGTQHKAFKSTKYGYFYIDAKRGEVHNLKNGSGSEEISRLGMKNWFKENLPFHITKAIKDVNTDNIYNGAGIDLCWDDRYERLFITKRDYKVKDASNLCYNSVDGTYRNIETRDEVIKKHTDNGFKLENSEDCTLNFTKTVMISDEQLPRKTDVYAYFDTTSMLDTDGVAAAAALQAWFNFVQAQNPNYDGNLYILPMGVEGWMRGLNITYTGSVNTTTSGLWPTITIKPANWNTASYVPPKDVIILSFIDEVQGGEAQEYHGSTSDRFGTPTQPTVGYVTDYTVFQTVRPNFNYFKQVLYPIKRTTADIFTNNVIQMAAALTGRILTPSEAAQMTQNASVDLTILSVENPYTQFGSLYNKGFVGILNKVSPAEDVFTSETFAAELSEVLDIRYTPPVYETYNVVEEFPIVDPENSDNFEDASWTIAYSPQTQSWVSWYSFIPNYYVDQIGYFQTGINSNNSSLWNHNMTNKSYQVFYNKYYPFEIEGLTKADVASKTLQSIQYKLDVLRYNNDHDYKMMQNISFTEAEIYNQLQTTGNLYLSLEDKKEVYSNITSTVESNGISINLSKTDNTFKFNGFYDIVKDKNSNENFYTFDASNVHKTINPSEVDYDKVKDVYSSIRMKSDYFKIKLKNTIHSRYKFIYKWIVDRLIRNP